MSQSHPSLLNKIEALLVQVKDPEIPVLSVMDMGIIRDIIIENDFNLTIKITPTYSACPAMEVIGVQIQEKLSTLNMAVKIEQVLNPAWTTDWITENGRKKLKDFGIVPPQDATMDLKVLKGETNILECPQCQSKNTKMVSQFGSTACKAIFKCQDCLEFFDYFKCLK